MAAARKSPSGASSRPVVSEGQDGASLRTARLDGDRDRGIGVAVLLADFDDRLPWKKTTGSVTATEVLRGSEETGLSVVLAEAPVEPSSGDLQAMWKARAGRSADPVLVLVTYPTTHGPRVSVLGPNRDAVPVSAIEVMTAARLAASALGTDSPVGLIADVRRRLASLRGDAGPGFRNEGLFASHILTQQPQRDDWSSLCQQSVQLLPERGPQLLTGLGFQVEHVPDGIVLRASVDKQRRAAAVLLLDEESFDNPLGRFAGSTAVTHGLALARRENVPWLIVLGGSVARLYSANPDVGVGRKGQTQTYVEVDLDLLSDSSAGYLALLFSPESLADGGTVATLLAESSKFATGLSERLRDRIYEDVIPGLAVAVAAELNIWDLPVDEQKTALDEAYHQAMIILFRLLFVAYAEDRGLLPLDVNEAYTANALKTLARRILNDPEGGFSETSTSMWNDLTQIWDVIDGGDLEGMGVPAYNGGLFARDSDKNPSGAATYDLRLTNADIGPVLRGLMIDMTDDDVLGLVDFRSLDVREFGTIYEGLLESGLGIADTDLTVDSNDTYVPAGKKDEVWVEADSIYFHSRSGTRKATGSYFTKPFAVQHLLDQALEPALDSHLERVKGLLDKEANQAAAEALFDFRVADLSMGSAHFLVAAIDRIEARFSAFIALNPMPEVLAELDNLRRAAATQLGVAPEDSGIDDGVLLRRQIARRCIYGVDINEIAVELARLAVWIHTFVPGLPLSFLNHGLIHGNSLTGVGTLDEIVQSLSEAEQRETKTSGGQSWLLPAALSDFIDRAGAKLDRLARLADASIADVDSALALQQDIAESLAPLTALCDLITAERTTRHLKKTDPDRILLSAGGGRLFTVADAASLEAAIMAHPELPRAHELATSVQATHLPSCYPEVFRRDPPGFDVILGNPPWEKLKVEEHGWWAVRFPGLRSMSQQDKNVAIDSYRSDRPDLVREYQADVASAKSAAGILSAGPYPGIGSTDIDLFAAFCWRFWHEVRPGGTIGVVLPRTAMSGAATSAWRNEVFTAGSITDLTTLVNRGLWAFEGIHPQWTIALLALQRGTLDHRVSLRGPFASAAEYQQGLTSGSMSLDAKTVLGWSDSAAIPLIPAADLEVFASMKAHPELGTDVGSWRFRPLAELHTTKEKWLYDFDLKQPSDGYTLEVWTGGTFNLWSPGSGDPYAYARPTEVEHLLQEKRANQIKLSSSAFYGLSREWAEDPTTLPMQSPRIAFRDVARATDSRTVIGALVPGGVALVHKAPYLVRLKGNERDEAYLLGTLSSIPFDWYARRFVEIAMTFELLNSFPVPRVDGESGRRLGPDGRPLMGDPDMRPLRDRVIEVAGRMAAVDKRYAGWAKAVGVPVGSVKTDAERDALIAELDALVALLYGLDQEQVEQVFASFHRGWDYRPRLAAVLKHFEAWSGRLERGR